MRSGIEERWSERSRPLFLDLDQTAQVANLISTQQVLMIENHLTDLLKLERVLDEEERVDAVLVEELGRR